MLIEAATLVAVLAATLYVYLTWNYNYWRKQGIVQVEPVVPGIGNLLQALLQKISAYTMHNNVYKEYEGQPAVGYFHLRDPALIVRDPDVIQTVLVNSFSKFHDNFLKISEKKEPYTVIDPFFSLGPKWKENRSAMAPAFTNARMKTLFPRMQELCGNLNQYLDKNLDKDVDATTVSRLYTTDVVSSCGFGLASNTVNGEINIFLRYGKMFMDEAISNGLVLFALFYTPTIANILRFRFVTPRISGFVQELVNTIIDYRDKNNVTQNDFLQMIVKTRDKEVEANPNDKQAQERSNVKMYGSALTFFMEGFETSSMVVRYALYELALNVECQKKLRDELQEATKEGTPLDYDTVMKLLYLDQVALETMRKYSPVLSMIKLCTETTTLQIGGRPVHIKEGTHIVIPIHGLHTDPKWFPNPEKFDPDRFSEENVKTRHHYSYLPFGEGPRICTGMRFAMAQVKACLANIVLNYNLLKCDTTPEQLTYNPKSWLLETNEPLLIRLQKRQRHMG